jgi:hypothetical protein
VEEVMNLEELKAQANQLKTKLLDSLGGLLQVLSKARDDYKRADNIETFFKTFLKEELMDQPKRILPTVVTVWILILLVFHWKFWIVFVFGILPIVLYYLIPIFRKTPTSEY